MRNKPLGALDQNPYTYIKCYHCSGLAVKASPDTYWCPNCHKSLLAAYPRDWKARKKEVFKRDGYRCRLCGRPLQYQEKHCDHVIPISLGGQHDAWNLHTLCVDCHLALHPDRQRYYYENRDRYPSTPPTLLPYIAPTEISQKGAALPPPFLLFNPPLFYIYLISIKRKNKVGMKKREYRGKRLKKNPHRERHRQLILLLFHLPSLPK